MSTALCPNGHQSTDPEWCDTCGTPLGAGSSASSSSGSGPTPARSSSPTPSASASASASAPQTTGTSIACPSCGDQNPESNLFCESCGLDFVTGQKPPEPAAPTPTSVAAAPAPGPPIDPGTDLGWSATLTIATDWFAAKGEGIGVPPVRPDRTVELRHASVVIGRTRSAGASPGITVDDDHGISRRHAELTHDADADTWSVTDLGSTNGTFVVAADVPLTGDMQPIPANVPLALAPDSVVYLGAWTRLVLVKA